MIQEPGKPTQKKLLKGVPVAALPMNMIQRSAYLASFVTDAVEK